FQELKIYVTGGSDLLPAYEQLAARLGLVASTLRSHVTRLRGRYREALRAEVRRTVISEAQVDEELRELLRVLTHRRSNGSNEKPGYSGLLCLRKGGERRGNLRRLSPERGT